MLISCNKLKTFIKDSEQIDWLNIWDKFTIRTAEVEGVTEVGNDFDNVVIAEIKECIKHPDSDHMHLLKVDCGENELIEVVCGAPNVRVGLKIAYVKVGGHIQGMEIKPKKLRGYMSNGMCCSMRELNIGDNHDGILELPTDAPVGIDIKKYLPISDIIVEIDNKSLTNRPDLWGHYGIAREIAAITNHELKKLDLAKIENDKEDLDIKISDPNLCYRYTGLKIENITNNKTPLEMQIFLHSIGYNSNSLIVDLTNYVMVELGQPMHAFDSRVVKNIEVSLAHDCDEFTTLDGVPRKLSKNNLMIKNDDKYFAIAGVMGGENSEIRPDTNSIFLESATFNAGSVRKTATELGLRTEASARYEKSLDPNMTSIAIERLVYLLKQENKELNISSNLTDVYVKPLTEATIRLNKETLSKYLGVTLSDDKIKEILEKLEFKLDIQNTYIDVTVPTFRHSKDINIEQDIIEEIARIYGLENFTPKPLKLDLTNNELETTFNQEYEVKEYLATKYNLHEVHSYIWYDTALLKKLEITKTGVKALGKVENNILRDDLGFSLLNIVERNFKNLNQFGIFEIGTIIQNNENKRVLSIILTDSENNLADIYMTAKSILISLFKTLKHQAIKLTNNAETQEYYDLALSKNISIEDQKYGELNVLKKTYTNKLAKKKSIVVIDIDFDLYEKLNKIPVTEVLVSKYPEVLLDYTIILPENKKYSDLEQVLELFKSNLIKSYSLVSVYENKYTIKYTIGSNDKTLGQKDLHNFKDRFLAHVKASGFDIKE